MKVSQAVYGKGNFVELNPRALEKLHDAKVLLTTSCAMHNGESIPLTNFADCEFKVLGACPQYARGCIETALSEVWQEPVPHPVSRKQRENEGAAFLTELSPCPLSLPGVTSHMNDQVFVCNERGIRKCSVVYVVEANPWPLKLRGYRESYLYLPDNVLVASKV